MSLSRWAKRKDGSQNEIVAALRKAGVRVYILDRPCDLLTWRPALGAAGWLPLECKPRQGGKISAGQQKFIEETGTPIVRTVEQALNAVGIRT